MHSTKTNTKPTLLILAAGMGSRYGSLKQIEPVGPSGETIIDYSIYDAVKAGFGKVVFVIRKSFAEPFRMQFEPKLKGVIDVQFAYQELDMLPEGFIKPDTREKPWGTAHAILVSKDLINEPFCALNADDFYGYNAYKSMAEFLTTSADSNKFAMVGYKLKNTLSEYGSVSRGICSVDNNGLLKKIVETVKITKSANNIQSHESDGTITPLTGEEVVSMNMWGFTPSLFEVLNQKFKIFLKEYINDKKREIFIPDIVYEMIHDKEAAVKVLNSDSSWFGVTYREDKDDVAQKIKELIEAGEYPQKLF